MKTKTKTSERKVKNLKEVYIEAFIAAFLDKLNHYQQPVKIGAVGSSLLDAINVSLGNIPVAGDYVKDATKILKKAIIYHKKQNRKLKTEKLSWLINARNIDENDIADFIKSKLYPIAMEIAHVFENQILLSKGPIKNQIRYVTNLAAIGAKRCMHALIHDKEARLNQDYFLQALTKKSNNSIGHTVIGVDNKKRKLYGNSVYLKCGSRNSYNSDNISYHSSTNGYKKKYGISQEVYFGQSTKSGHVIHFYKKAPVTPTLNTKFSHLTLAQEIKLNKNNFYKLSISIEGQDLKDYMFEVKKCQDNKKEIPTLNDFIQTRYKIPNKVEVICRSLEFYENGKKKRIKDLSHGKFENVTFNYLDMNSTKLDKADFTQASLLATNLSNCSIKDTKFIGSYLCHATLKNLNNVHGADFAEAYVAFMKLGSSNGKTQDLENSNLQHAKKFELIQIQGGSSNIKLNIYVAIKVLGRNDSATPMISDKNRHSYPQQRALSNKDSGKELRKSQSTSSIQKQKILTGPNNIQYHLISVPGDGDCGYTAFGVSRRYAYDLLLNNLDKPVVKGLIAQTIEGELLDTNSLFTIHLRNKGMLDKNLSPSQLSKKDDIIREYLKYDILDKNIDMGWAHFNTLKALAEIKNRHLQIWEKSGDNKLKLHRHSTQERNTQNKAEIHLLYSNNNHFDRLKKLELKIENSVKQQSNKHKQDPNQLDKLKQSSGLIRKQGSSITTKLTNKLPDNMVNQPQQEQMKSLVNKLPRLRLTNSA